MKALTISVADDLYQRASQKAAAKETSLPKIVENLLCEWAGESFGSTGNTAASGCRADFLEFLDDLAARPLKPGPSVGPLNREELYQRGVSGH